MKSICSKYCWRARCIVGRLTGEQNAFPGVSPRHFRLGFAADFASNQRVREDLWILRTWHVVERYGLCNRRHPPASAAGFDLYPTTEGKWEEQPRRGGFSQPNRGLGGSKFSQRSVGRVPSRKRFWCILGLHMKQLLVITSHHSSTLGRHGDPKLKGEGEHVSPVPNGLMPTNVRLCRCDERLQRE